MQQRYTVQTTPQGMEIRIPAKRTWLLPFLLVWLAAWTMGGVFASNVAWQSYEAGKPDTFVLIWLLAWVFGMVNGLCGLLWQLVGSEIWRIGNGEWQISYTICGMGRTKMYAQPLISDFKTRAFNPNQANRYPSIRCFFTGEIADGALSFNYQNQTIYCGAELDEANAKILHQQVAAMGIRAA